jgi:hypothetical protein
VHELRKGHSKKVEKVARKTASSEYNVFGPRFGNPAFRSMKK